MTTVAPALVKLTVNLTEANYAALLAAAARSGDDKTTTINRALQVYDFVTREIEQGWKFQLQRGAYLQEVSFE